MSEVATKPAGVPETGADALAPLRLAAPWIAAAAVLVVLPFVFTSGAGLTMLSLMGIMIVFTLSYNMLLGQTGMLSFGHAVYYGLGAFFAAHAMNMVIRNGLPIPLALIPIVGGLFGLAFGILFGWVSTKRGGTAFAMISLGLAELVASSANILRGFFGGEEGITTNRTKLAGLFGYNFGPQIQVYFLIAAWCLVCMVLMYSITRTPLGRMCNAVRENPERVQFVGYDPRMVRFIAFALASLFAGIAGSLAAINFEIVNSTYVGVGQSGIVLLAAYVGGIGFFFGPIIGAIIVTYLQVMLSDVTEIWQLYFGLMFIVIVMFAPSGVAGLIMMHQPLWRARVVQRVIPAYLVALPPGLAFSVASIAVIEMIYHAAAKAGESPKMTFLQVPIDVSKAITWLAAAAVLAGTFFLFRLTWPLIARAWGDATLAARERGAAG
jgi:branched-chain amino acid transport system permease protein